MNILDIAKEAGAYHADKTIDSVLESGAIAFANKAQLTKFAELLLAGQSARIAELQAQLAELIKFQGQTVAMAETIANLQAQLARYVEVGEVCELSILPKSKCVSPNKELQKLQNGTKLFALKD